MINFDFVFLRHNSKLFIWFMMRNRFRASLANWAKKADFQAKKKIGRKVAPKIIPKASPERHLKVLLTTAKMSTLYLPLQRKKKPKKPSPKEVKYPKRGKIHGFQIV